MCPASRAGKFAGGVVEKMSLQMLCAREAPSASIMVACEPLLTVLRKAILSLSRARHRGSGGCHEILAAPQQRLVGSS